MSLSVGNRRAIQSQTSLGVQSQHLVTFRSRHEQPRVGVQRQRSFFTSGSDDITSARREYMRRGVSVGRSFDGIRQKSAISLERRKNLGSQNLQRQFSLSEQPASNTIHKKDQFRSKYFGSLSRYAGSENFSDLTKPSNNEKKIAWSSTSSLLKSFEEELAQNNDLKKSNVKENTLINSKSSKEDLRYSHVDKDASTKSATSDQSKFNINIVLSQTIEAITENDVDSASETAEPEKNSKITTQIKNQASSLNRRNQIQHSNSKNQSSSSHDTNLILVSSNSLANGNGEKNLNVSPLTIQRRPPLIRAMSAPVRTLDDNNKSLSGFNKRKSRRRKVNSNYSPDKPEFDSNSGQGEANICSEGGSKNIGKKGLSRSISALAPDVITLVSLVSSEGSDSERDDGEAITQTHSARRAPSLRRTGKSVSFQENDPPNFQFTSKEFPTMRRGSIVQLAARIRANRPNAASPVSIFLAEAYNCDRNLVSSSSTSLNNNESTAETAHIERRKMSLIRESENDSVIEKTPQIDDDYPEYVRTLKERECWKLFQKMSKKGVAVTYDTILRGMLTPTELRQLQKQREIQEEKARKTEIGKEAEQMDKKPTAVTAIERLTEVLLKK